MAAKELWKIEDVARFIGVGVSWVYKRTAPNTSFYPKIPRVANKAHPRFDPEVIRALFSTAAPKAGASSLKIEKMGSLHSKDTSTSKRKRRFEKL